MYIGIGIKHVAYTAKPTIKLEMFPSLRLPYREMIDDMINLAKKSKGIIIPWGGEDVFPTDMKGRFPISICCYIEFKSISDEIEFEQIVKDFQFS